MEEWVRGRTTPQRLVERAKIVLASADGLAGEAICAAVGVSRPTVSLWLNRYEAEGRDALVADRPRSGRPATAAMSVTWARLSATVSGRSYTAVRMFNRARAPRVAAGAYRLSRTRSGSSAALSSAPPCVEGSRAASAAIVEVCASRA